MIKNMTIIAFGTTLIAFAGCATSVSPFGDDYLDDGRVYRGSLMVWLPEMDKSWSKMITDENVRKSIENETPILLDADLVFSHSEDRFTIKMTSVDQRYNINDVFSVSTSDTIVKDVSGTGSFVLLNRLIDSDDKLERFSKMQIYLTGSSVYLISQHVIDDTRNRPHFVFVGQSK